MDYSKLKNFSAEKFSAPDISDVSYDNQLAYFNIVRDEFTELNQKQNELPKDVFVRAYGQKIMDVIEMSAGGIVPAQDFLCYLYKRGLEDLMPADLVRAHEWGILAVSNGSKLSIERLRLFFDPVYNYVLDSGKIENIIVKNKITDEQDVTDFIAQSYCILLVDEMKIDLLTVAKKPLVEKSNFIRFSHDATEANKKVLPKLLDLIA